jgi:hypothetical protein
MTLIMRSVSCHIGPRPARELSKGYPEPSFQRWALVFHAPTKLTSLDQHAKGRLTSVLRAFMVSLLEMQRIDCSKLKNTRFTWKMIYIKTLVESHDWKENLRSTAIGYQQ